MTQTYPTQDKSARLADATVHALGVTFALIGGTLLVGWAAMHASGAHVAALAIYGFGLVATFLASGVYHMTPWHHVRPTLRRIDHAAIFVMIAGTITPLAVMVDTTFAYVLLAAVWAIAAVGVTRKLFFWATPGRLGPLIYLAMGWLGILLVRDLMGLVPDVALGLMVAGGALYSIGVLFYAVVALRFGTAIWHGFVVAASACFFAAIAISAAALT
ncbi:hemolysin III family protein [Loktanella sp. SALINAS62]|uniref:PAQR family membrane homeostasis protein TrhA n=1 Tax=Loktanella sp. SALINAS62 TaxID=2706124 RepID=UPI001B8B7EC2|nr:hemolysin III family protein [Loktanella sp. SALINAS62]MBS1303993.1 hemolysin III [Loktanella sp. SALINAS62]